MNADEYFNEVLEIEPAYETELEYFKPFWDFKYRFQSLQRHWVLNKRYLNNHISTLSAVKGDGSAEFFDVFSETANVDIEYFPEYLRLSTISFALSLVENMLGALSEEIASDLGVSISLDKRPLPFINKYILWITHGCGIPVDIKKPMWKSLDAIREMRNRFIHRIGRDIPEQIKKVITEMVASSASSNTVVTDEFVDVSFVKRALKKWRVSDDSI
jgi:hypothetical protein